MNKRSGENNVETVIIFSYKDYISSHVYIIVGKVEIQKISYLIKKSQLDYFKPNNLTL